MTATIGDILLVLLADRPGTAYELQQRHAQTFGPQRAVDVTRVVAALSRQERLGNVRARDRASLGSQRVHTLTEAGRRWQRAWILDVPPEVSGPDVVDRVLLAMTATDRATFDAVLGSCLAVLESQRSRAGHRSAAPVVSARHALAEFEDAVASSTLEWVRHLAGRRRERDAA